MDEGRASTKSLHDIGTTITILGVYMIIEFVIIFLLTIAIFGSLANSVYTYDSVSDFIHNLVSQLRFLAVATFVVYGIELFIIFNLTRKLDQTIQIPHLNLGKNRDAKRFFLISVALNVFASIIGWIILNVFLNDLDTSASSSIEEIEGVIARAEGGGVFSNLIGAIAAVIIVYAYLNLRDYLNNLYYKYRSHSIKEAADKINITKNGSILIAIATFIQIIPNESISWLLSLPGGIMVVYGLIAGGGQLGRVPFNLTEIGSQKSRDPHSTSRKTSLISKMAYTQKESLQIGSEEKRLEDIYCVICGTRNGQDFNYCKSCGAKLHDLQVS